MKKTLKIAALAAGVVVLAGCGGKNTDNTNQGGTGKNQEANQSASSADKGGVISSIKDAMGLGKTMRCTYRIKNKEGEMETVAYVDGKKYMTEMTIAGNAQKSIFNEDGMYSWSVSEKRGTKMSKACMDELAKGAPKSAPSADQDVPGAPDPTGEKAFDGATDVKCEDVSDVDFSIPTDVNFVDQCEMMKKMMDNVRNMPTVPNMPNSAGMGADQGVPNLNAQ